MLQNAYFLAKIGADTAENEQHFAEICQKMATTLRVRSGGRRSSAVVLAGAPGRADSCARGSRQSADCRAQSQLGST